MPSNAADYDINWRFQLDYNKTSYVKILTEDGNLAVTFHSHQDDEHTFTTLQGVISGTSGNDYDYHHQGFFMCNDCPGEQ